MKFPNKVIKAAYESAKGKVFTWSPTNQVFTDENGLTDYNYFAMIWLMNNRILEELPWDHVSLVYKFKVKE